MTVLALPANLAEVRTYGQQLKALRGDATQEEIAARMGMSRQGNLPQYENDKKRPSVKTVLRHAQAYGKKPSEFLANVIVTEYDRVRAGEYDDVKIPAPMPRPVKGARVAIAEQRHSTAQKGGRRVSRRN